MRWLRGLGALGALILVLVGAPVALARLGRLPSRWPASAWPGSGWPEALSRPDDGSILLVALTAIGWLAWAAFALSVAAEAARLLSSGRVRIRIPLLGGLQHLSAGLVVAVLALMPPQPSQVEAPVASRVLATPERAAQAAPGDSERVDPPGQAGYLVAPGDDLWTVSRLVLGDGGRWRELAAANPVGLADPTRPLTPGMRLAVPGARAHAETVHVRVERGDTLSGLALEYLGAGARWPRIASANPDLVSDPDHIEVGWRLVVPGAERAPRSALPRAPHPRAEEHPSREERPKPEEHPKPEQHPKVEDGPSSGQEPGTSPAETTPAETSPAKTSPAKTTPAETSPAETSPARAVPQTVGPRTEPHAPPVTAEARETPVPLAALLGTLGTLAAAAIVGSLEARRYLRLRERPVGRRLLPPDGQAARLQAAMGARQRPDRLAVLDAAMRAIGEHCFRTGSPLPELARVVVSEATIAFHWVQAPAGLPPAGFTAEPQAWTVRLGQGDDLPTTEHPCPFPALVSLGSTTEGDLLLVDAERSRVLGVAAADAELRRSTLASLGVELGCAPWAQELRLVVAGEGSELIRLAGGERVQLQPAVVDAVAQLKRLVSRRRAALEGAQLGLLRVDPDRADAVAPVVFLFLGDVATELASQLDGLLQGAAIGLAVILATETGATAQWSVTGDALAPVGRLAGSPDPLLANGIPEATRTGVASLFRASEDPETTPAPWWSGTGANVRALPQISRRGAEPVDVVRLVPASVHPQVLLIGPTELRGATGPEPSRSRQQLVELCTWLLEHPGCTATAMASGLAVAEGTRRSNLSRLRNWLGEDSDGQAYLPDAYSGRVLLHPGVTSDWQRVQLLLSPGIDLVGDSTLLAALELVRGAPLADAAPGQWHWAEELRTDISSALRDAGLVLSDRALARGDIDLARWAAARALVVAPEDEQLLCARIRTEHRAGNRVDVERLVNQVTRQARMLGVDLLPETVELCQQVIEGRLRARA